jgi:hypothetical protein
MKLYVNHPDYEAVLNLNNITSLQRFKDRIVIHFPDETFTIMDDNESFDVINAYFDAIIQERMRLRDFLESKKDA